ncbi:CDP-glycerol--poly(glycerophosphate) glycerophosphotransferase [Carboxydothermus hydrogenoformans]|uniref:CDP-Glycerol:Poly(Glycerophosphate) glycerophosphotransferase family protein n=1 Tax=Carboxydothermus hydrogenoformans (strain ATCC BAA-161 / DSM 6008 / Z-2901) TaxID=246194 RepID=Q3A904_CARHZ|nr:CDP-glycerol--poly(glycerophosphate) glycerophosphotransferase [Carboxydothermus hydrogenoformans]ABB15698.1 CDP-Glycerol:Poly(glycerophosphate) glycerophosphotransferase family protein [Carboxydothermus hydrogenoformans Z-2901]
MIGFLMNTKFHYTLYEPIIKHLNKSDYRIILTEGYVRNVREARKFLTEKGIEFWQMIDKTEQNLIKENIKVFLGPFFFPTVYRLKPEAHHFRMVYGLAKDGWNYAWWNIFFDLIFVYGDYDAEKLSFYAPVVKAGNPRFDRWFKGEVVEDKVLELAKGRPVILYLPTYGELSSWGYYQKALEDLSERYLVIAKLHHGLKVAEGNKIVIRDESADLLSLLKIADVVISDYSGAIFDAMLAGKKILLFNLPQIPEHLSSKESLENIIRGYCRQVNEPAEVRGVIEELLHNDAFLSQREAMKAKIFSNTAGNSGEIIAKTLYEAQNREKKLPHGKEQLLRQMERLALPQLIRNKKIYGYLNKILS